jgi:hypothetical protein
MLGTGSSADLRRGTSYSLTSRYILDWFYSTDLTGLSRHQAVAGSWVALGHQPLGLG